MQRRHYTRSVAHQATRRGELAQRIGCGQRITDRQCGHSFPTGVEERVAADEQRNSPTLGEPCKGPLDFPVATGFDNQEFLSARLRRRLHISQLFLGVSTQVRVHEHRNCARLGHKLAQQLKPLRN
jgi:hypothetical protein